MLDCYLQILNDHRQTNYYHGGPSRCLRGQREIRINGQAGKADFGKLFETPRNGLEWAHQYFAQKMQNELWGLY